MRITARATAKYDFKADFTAMNALLPIVSLTDNRF
jgi:hypothetical protein